MSSSSTLQPPLRSDASAASSDGDDAQAHRAVGDRVVAVADAVQEVLRLERSSGSALSILGATMSPVR